MVRSSAIPLGAALCALIACSSDDGSDKDGSKRSTVASPANGQSGMQNAATGGTTGSHASTGGMGGSAMQPSLPGTGGKSGGGAGMAGGGSGGMAAMMANMMGTGAGGSPMMMGNNQTPFTGPLDGDPNKPMVEIPGIPCGVPNIGFGGAPPSVKITDRDVVVAYPCAHEGAAVTFFLFLHGTVDEPIKVTFTMNAWPIHQLVDSHNIIVVAPKAIGTQWGNGDDGKDLPHLYDVVNWVYDTFGEKFNIRSMWAQGGSWGAFYLTTVFACDPMFQDRLKGVQVIVGGGCPACSDRLSCMVGQQELQLGNGMALSPDAREMAADSAMIAPYATMHGCDGKMGPTPVGNTQSWYWPSCDPGWTHSYYLGPGQHADAWDPAAVLKTTEDIKATEM
jgi:hypothetical protein